MDMGGNSLPSGPDGVKRKVSYYYDPGIGNYYYGKDHHMKPHRIRMAHALIQHYGLLNNMEIVKPFPAKDEDFREFHADNYVEFLKRITPETQKQQVKKLWNYNMAMGDDCPVFDGLYNFCKSYTGGSLAGAFDLNHGSCDIAINWAGGLHHAKKSEASVFCYVNDIVLAILELLKHHERVLYVDIDVQHGDGVEEAFYTTNRVMTVSFHQFGSDFFPYTGNILDIGCNKGKYYSLNVPLHEGIDDEKYHFLFKTIMGKVMEVYKPSVVVLQCGADSLTGDALGGFNLSIKGHAECVKYMRSFNVPLLLLGGGGYTIDNVSHCWCYEVYILYLLISLVILISDMSNKMQTGVALGVEVDIKIPEHEYYESYGPDYTLNISPSKLKDKNSWSSLYEIRAEILDHLSEIEHAPSIQFYEKPPHFELLEADEDQDDADSR